MLLKHAEIFRDVAGMRSFSQAARARGVSQPAVSHAIQQLEEHFGVTLLDRSSRPLKLTEAGETYFKGCVPLLDQFEELESRVRQTTGQVSGEVRVAAIYSVGLMEMNGLIDAFHAQHPAAHIDIRYAHPDVVTAQVAAGEVELGLTSFPELATDLDSVDWRSQTMSVVVPPEHEWAVEAARGERAEVRLEELAERPFVGLTPELATRRQIDSALRAAAGEADIVQQFDNIDTVLRAVSEGAGISIVPELTARRAVEAGDVVVLPIAGRPLSRSLGIVMRKRSRLSKATETFIAALQACRRTEDDLPSALNAGRRKPGAGLTDDGGASPKPASSRA